MKQEKKERDKVWWNVDDKNALEFYSLLFDDRARASLNIERSPQIKLQIKAYNIEKKKKKKERVHVYNERNIKA